MFLILREPADLLATAVITYRNEDETDSKRLTGEPRTLDHTSMDVESQRLFYIPAGAPSRHHLRQRTSKTSTKFILLAQIIVETSDQYWKHL